MAEKVGIHIAHEMVITYYCPPPQEGDASRCIRRADKLRETRGPRELVHGSEQSMTNKVHVAFGLSINTRAQPKMKATNQIAKRVA